MFEPFTPKGKETERTAVEVKKHLGIGCYDSVNPFDVLDRVPARIVSNDAIACIPPEIRDGLFRDGRNHWSAVGLGRMPLTGEELILLNPAEHPHRAPASLMEELVHIILDHPRVELKFNTNGGWKRPFDDDIEDEAYNVGAACIVPYRWLFYELKGGNTDLCSIAKGFGVSVSYIEFRIKRAGLYRVYQKACADGGS